MSRRWRKIFEVFRHDPLLAEMAFDLDPQAAEAIMKERLPALRGSAMPGTLENAVIEHRVISAYPYLFRSIAEGTEAVHMIAQPLGQALEGADTNLVEQFRFALSAFLGDALRRDDPWTGPGAGILSVFKVAMQYGVVVRFHALVEYHYSVMTDIQEYEILSRYIELPADPPEALTRLRTCDDCLRWDPAVCKFRMTGARVGANEAKVGTTKE